jgi:hypothetical protein
MMDAVLLMEVHQVNDDMVGMEQHFQFCSVYARADQDDLTVSHDLLQVVGKQ